MFIVSKNGLFASELKSVGVRKWAHAGLHEKRLIGMTQALSCNCRTAHRAPFFPLSFSPASRVSHSSCLLCLPGRSSGRPRGGSGQPPTVSPVSSPSVPVADWSSAPLHGEFPGWARRGPPWLSSAAPPQYLPPPPPPPPSLLFVCVDRRRRRRPTARKSPARSIE